ncbi:MAG: hypothetical protein ABF320_02610, partial [Lentimonas sp.]
LSLDQDKLVSKAVSNLPKNKNVLVAEDDSISRSLLGMDFYLPKPVRLKELREVLVEVIREADVAPVAS